MSTQHTDHPCHDGCLIKGCEGTCLYDGKPRKAKLDPEAVAEFYDTIPERLRVHLSEADVEREYIHHYGRI